MTDETARQPAQKRAGAPIIIWTLRRTGGTNLGTSLFERSPFPAVQQEPFNDDRIYGAVTAEFRTSADEPSLRAALRKILSGQVLIKHCVETVPPRLSRILAEEAVAAGYHHMFLFRRHALGRLLSLHFAQRSGIWGKEMAGGRHIDDGIFAEPLPVDELVAHEIDCRRRLNAVHDRLAALGVSPLLVAFEDIYADADAGAVAARLHALLAGLGLSAGDESDRGFIARVAGGEQGTRDKYARFANYDELAAAINALPLYSPVNRDLRVSLPDLYPPALARLYLWSPRFETDATVTLSGIVLPRRRGDFALLVEDAAGLHAVGRWLPSERIADEFPDVPGSSHARFQAAGLRFSDSGEIRLLARFDGDAPFVLAVVSERL